MLPHALIHAPAHAAEVMRWVEETKLPLDAEERQLLLAELSAEAASARRQQDRPWQRHAPPPAVQSGGSFDGGGGGVRGRQGTDVAAGAGAAASSRDAAQLGAQPPRASQAGTQRELAGGWSGAGGTAPGATAGARAVGRAPGLGPSASAGAEPEIVPAVPEETEAGAGASALEWLARCRQQAAAALGAALQPLLPAAALGDGAQAGGSADAAATLRLLGGSCLGAVLLYAAYAERQAIRQGAQRARRGVAAALGDLARMALSLQVNPLAASAPGWR